MNHALSTLRPHTARLVALVVLVVLYTFTRLPSLAKSDRALLVDRFSFERTPLFAPGGVQVKHIRDVHPSLDHISGWISTVGAAVALNDVDGDGLPNDICHVDPRYDRVILSPAPGTGARFAPFTLDPDPLPYDGRTTAPTGCIPGDLNEDGRTDVLVYYWGRTPIAFLRSDTVGPLTGDSFVPVEVLQSSERWFTNAATRADVDGDGHVDLIIGNYFQDDARILDAQADGVEAMQDSMSRARNAGRNRLLLFRSASSGASPTVVFEDIADAIPDDAARGWTLAAGAADLDGDLLPEIYFGHDFGPDSLLHNRSTPGHPRFEILHGRKTLTTPNSKVLGHDSFKGMGVDFGDVNGDGTLDIFVSNIAAEYALEESHFLWESCEDASAMQDGIAPYRDRSEPLGLSRSGWGWDTRLADFDNDGVLEAMQATGFLAGRVDRWPELHELAMGNDQLVHSPLAWHRFTVGDALSGNDPNPFFVRSPGGRYFDIAADIGLGEPMMTRGIASADVDGDGDLDFAIANQWDVSYFFENRCPQPGAFLGLHVLLPESTGNGNDDIVCRTGHPTPGMPTSPAINAQATVTLPDGRTLVAHSDGGNGHSGARSNDLHFGLGDVAPDAPLPVYLRWRDRAGEAREATLHLVPGWHTVMLGMQGTGGT